MTLQELSDHIKGLLESGVPPTAKLYQYLTRSGLSEGIEIRAEYTDDTQPNSFGVADIVCFPMQINFGELKFGDLS